MMTKGSKGIALPVYSGVGRCRIRFVLATADPAVDLVNLKASHAGITGQPMLAAADCGCERS